MHQKNEGPRFRLVEAGALWQIIEFEIGCPKGAPDNVTATCNTQQHRPTVQSTDSYRGGQMKGTMKTACRCLDTTTIQRAQVNAQ